MNKEFEIKRQKLNDMFSKVADAIHIQGIENLPSEGINIFVANHSCFLDIFLIPYVVNNPCISLVSANSLFGSNIERKNKLNDLLYPFPVETRAGEHYTDTCTNGAIDLLSQGKSLIIFPEGVFCEEGTVLKARTGTVRMLFEALERNNTKINLIPIALKVSGVRDENIQSSDVWEDFGADITILPEFDYANYHKEYLVSEDTRTKNIILHNMMDDIMKSIAKELGFKYIDEYGALYDMEGFWFPNGKFVKFEESQEDTLYIEYKKLVEELMKRYTEGV